MNKNRLFVASCVSLVTTSMVFAIRGDVAGPMSTAFQITNEQMGLIFSPAFWAFTISIFISGALVDVVGMRALHVLSAHRLLHRRRPRARRAASDRARSRRSSPRPGTTLLYAGFFVMGLSQGLVEGVINPLVATIYSDQKTKRLNMLHAWWPGGQVIGGLLAVRDDAAFGASWQLKLVTILDSGGRSTSSWRSRCTIRRPSASSRTSPPARCGARRPSRSSCCCSSACG